MPISGILTVPLSVANELEDALSSLTSDERYHFLRKAQGAEEGELSWFFEGRTRERAAILEWVLRRRGGMLVVTGPAGSGKSALLGYVLVNSLPELRSALVKSGLIEASPANEIPLSGVFDQVIHLTGMTLDALIERIAEAAGLGRNADLAKANSSSNSAANADWLITELSKRNSPLTLLMDALDEAVDPISISRTILRPLAQMPFVKIIVGTRQSTRETPDHPATADSDLLDALQVAQGGREQIAVVRVARDREAIRRYTIKRLISARGAGRLQVDGQPASDEAILHAGERIGTHDRHFLFARLAVHEIITEPSLLQPSRSVTLNRLLANDHRLLFASAVDRVSRLSDSFRPLLEALALARGRGVPMRNGVWALMASALLRQSDIDLQIGDDDVSSLLRVAQPYIAADTELGQTVYRLSHRTFVEHFLREWGQQ